MVVAVQGELGRWGKGLDKVCKTIYLMFLIYDHRPHKAYHMKTHFPALVINWVIQGPLLPRTWLTEVANG